MKNKQTLRQFLGIKAEVGKPFIIKHNGNEVYREYANGDWWRHEYDAKGNRTYFEDSDGYWWKSKYDTKGNGTYIENSDGYVYDNRPKELTMDEIAEKFNIPVEQLKIKK